MHFPHPPPPGGDHTKWGSRARASIQLFGLSSGNKTLLSLPHNMSKLLFIPINRCPVRPEEEWKPWRYNIGPMTVRWSIRCRLASSSPVVDYSCTELRHMNEDRICRFMWRVSGPAVRTARYVPRGEEPECICQLIIILISRTRTDARFSVFPFPATQRLSAVAVGPKVAPRWHYHGKVHPWGPHSGKAHPDLGSFLSLPR